MTTVNERGHGGSSSKAPSNDDIPTGSDNKSDGSGPQALPAPLQVLTRDPFWVCWRWVTKNGKLTKVPFQVNGKLASSTDPSTWTTYAHATKAFAEPKNKFDGIGFVLTNSEFAAFDLDHCLNLETGFIEPWAKSLVERCPTYSEITPSGTGVRIIGRGVGDHMHRKLPVPNANGMSCECFRKAKRFITITGNKYVDRPLGNIDVQLDEVLAELEAGQKKNKSENKSGGHQLPPHLSTMLLVPNLGAGKRHGDYASRSAMLAGFIRLALDAKTSDGNIVLPCVDKQYKDNAIYEHCAENGGLDYVRRQLDRVRALTPPSKRSQLIAAASIKPRAKDWLWPGHLLRGAQELMTGVPGLGKSQVQISFIACATTGSVWPDGAPGIEPMNVIMLTAEDTLHQEVIPRLMAADADVDRVTILKCIHKDGKDRPVPFGGRPRPAAGVGQ